MSLFRRQLRPEDLGSMLYETLRDSMQSDGDLSMEKLLHGLDIDAATLDEQYVGEIMVGLMFAATMAIERSAAPRVAEQISAGLRVEFFNHILEQGASQIQKAEWDAVIAGHFLEYQKCLDGYTGFEPPWKLGRQFYWNIIGTEDYLVMRVKIATLYLLAARTIAQELLNQHGPSLVVTRPSPSEL